MSDFSIKRGDVGRVIDAILSDADTGTAVDLTGATVTAVLKHSSTEAVQTAACTIVGAATNGRVRFTSVANHSATVGRLSVEWEVNFGGGVITTYPSSGYSTIHVTSDLNP